MSTTQCPLCGQDLPATTDTTTIQRRLSDLTGGVINQETTRIQQLRDRDRLRHESEIAALQSKLEQLTRRLEKQSNDRRGQEGELDLAAALRHAFPQDQFKIARRGEKTADIIQFVFEDGRELGQVIYENKNVATWSSEYVQQLKKYRLQHKTAYAMLVSTALPGNRTGLCTHDGILIAEPSFAVPLARVLRDAVVQVGEFTSAQVDREQKTRELLEYISGQDFQNRFREVLEAADDLTSQQQRDRTYHENSWEKQRKALTRIQNAHRSISVMLGSVLRGTSLSGHSESCDAVETLDGGEAKTWWRRLVDRDSIT